MVARTQNNLYCIFISSLVFFGQSCVDLDPDACAEMARQNDKMCMDTTLATQVCPKYCRRCPITCYNCNSSTTDVSNCNTITCTNDQVCMVKEIHAVKTGQHRYVLWCADMLICDGERKRSVQKRSFSIDCCLDDLCNTPALITTTTTSTISPATAKTSTIALFTATTATEAPFTATASTKAPTTAITSTKAPTTATISTVVPTTTTTATVTPKPRPQTPPLPGVVTDSPLTKLHPCVDKLPNCAAYDKNTACVGQYEPWAIENGFKYCGKCTPSLPGITTNSLMTTLPPCADKLLNCAAYDKNTACVGQYEPWANDWYPKYCNKCSNK